MVRAAYPCEVFVKFEESRQDEKVIPYTFEDALVLANIPMFRQMQNEKGLIKKMAEAVNQKNIDAACQSMFDALDSNAKKAEMALDLLYTTEPRELNPPQYIAEGLDWLKDRLDSNASFIATLSKAAEVESE